MPLEIYYLVSLRSAQREVQYRDFIEQKEMASWVSYKLAIVTQAEATMACVLVMEISSREYRRRCYLA